jgi:tryptophan synthase alpha chain
VSDARVSVGVAAAEGVPGAAREAPSLARRFAERREQGRVVLIAYVTAGFPSDAETVPLLEAIADAGADVLELGIPFSDPLADGPTIQRASFVALERGMTSRRALALLAEFRSRRDTPVVLMTYLNPVLRYGTREFCVGARSAGAQGIILTDLPVGSDPELERAASSSGLDLVRLVAPTTTGERIAEVAAGGSGFLYYISRTGVTGARAELPAGLAEEVRAVKVRVSLPVAVGFGISTPEQAAAVAGVADGVVVGSALIRSIEEGGVEGARRFIAGLRQAMDKAARG